MVPPPSRCGAAPASVRPLISRCVAKLGVHAEVFTPNTTSTFPASGPGAYERRRENAPMDPGSVSPRTATVGRTSGVWKRSSRCGRMSRVICHREDEQLQGRGAL